MTTAIADQLEGMDDGLRELWDQKDSKSKKAESLGGNLRLNFSLVCLGINDKNMGNGDSAVPVRVFKLLTRVSRREPLDG